MKRLLFVAALLIAALAPAVSHAQSLDAGVRLFEAKKYAEAKTFFSPFAGRNAEAAYYMGRIAMDENDDKAADWFETATKMSPTSSLYFDWYGRALGNQAIHASKWKMPFIAPKVRNAFERAVALDPDNLDAREYLIQYYLQAPGVVGGSKQKAREMALEIRKRNAYRGGLQVANVCAGEKDLPCVEREMLALKAVFPDSSVVYTELAAFYASQKNFDKSFVILDERLKAKPDDMNATFAIGRTGALSGQNLDRAEKALKSYLASPPPVNPIPPANVHFRLGMVYDKEGKRDLARGEYTAALRLNPKLNDAKKALDALGG
ncbi:MAG: tetratricopeptide repeat protein [Gemmatimonadota bacterium]|nr:tetratricopeptide repeat protein [Gemmatimonadota bacterium]